MLIAALWSRSSDRPHAHEIQRSLSDRCSKLCPHAEQVLDVQAGLTSTTPRPASSALACNRWTKYPQPASTMLLARWRFLTMFPMRRFSTALRSYRDTRSHATLLSTSLRVLAMRSCSTRSAATALRRFLPPLRLRATRRWATRSRRWAVRYQAGFALCSPSDVVSRLEIPTSMPTSFPVAGSGSAWYSTEKQAYQPLGFLIGRRGPGRQPRPAPHGYGCLLPTDWSPCGL